MVLQKGWYIQGTMHHGIKFEENIDTKLIRYCDSALGWLCRSHQKYFRLWLCVEKSCLFMVIKKVANSYLITRDWSRICISIFSYFTLKRIFEDFRKGLSFFVITKQSVWVKNLICHSLSNDIARKYHFIREVFEEGKA